MRINLLLLATVTAAQVAAQAPRTTPDFGPNVTIFDPATPAATIKSTLDSIFASQESSEFGAGRFALLFKPGKYDVDARIGFYTQVSGLGLSPNDVVQLIDICNPENLIPGPPLVLITASGGMPGGADRDAASRPWYPGRAPRTLREDCRQGRGLLFY